MMNSTTLFHGFECVIPCIILNANRRKKKGGGLGTRLPGGILNRLRL